jgi:hypothetical protein
MNNYLVFFSIPLIGYVGYKGYEYGKSRFYEYVFAKVSEELDRRLQKEDEEELFKPNAKSKSAIIKFSHGGKTHDVYIPYDRSKSTSMLRKRIFLIREDKKIELVQKPGIPYLVSADQMGGTQIIVENLSGEIIRTYSESEVPGYF